MARFRLMGSDESSGPVCFDRKKTRSNRRPFSSSRPESRKYGMVYTVALGINDVVVAVDDVVIIIVIVRYRHHLHHHPGIDEDDDDEDDEHLERVKVKKRERERERVKGNRT